MSQPATSSTQRASYTSALAVVATVFFLFGFATSLNGILVPHLQDVFTLNYAESMLVQSAFFLAYLVCSIPAGKYLEKVGYQSTMVTGLAVTGIGALVFVPAAAFLSFPFFLVAIFVLATGVVVLQVAANPFTTTLGTPETAASRLNLAQALNSLGTTLAPSIGGVLIIGAAGSTDKLAAASRVKVPYVGMAVVLFILAFLLSRFKFSIPPTSDASHEDAASGDRAWKHPVLLMGAVGLFVYVGAEVSIGTLLTKYLHQPDVGNLPEAMAAAYVSFYWGGSMVGRFIGAAVLQKMSARPLLSLVSTVACALVLTSAFSAGMVAMWSLILVGLFNSVMFPSIFALGVAGLPERLKASGSGLLAAAIVGGAIIPYFTGVLADSVGLHLSLLLSAACYAYILFYGAVGSRQPAKA